VFFKLIKVLLLVSELYMLYNDLSESLLKLLKIWLGRGLFFLHAKCVMFVRHSFFGGGNGCKGGASCTR